MKYANADSSTLRENSRIDAKYYLSPAMRIKSFIRAGGRVTGERLGNYAQVFQPSRFKRVYAVPGESYVPYLRAYDVFEFLPPEADRLSVARTAKLDSYRIQAGDILQTCSGRNLGPTTIADAYLSQFVLSHDMIRIRIANADQRHYTLAFLKSDAGQLLLRSDLNGSVIDHITVGQVSDTVIPLLSNVYRNVAATMGEAIAKRDAARTALRAAISALNERHPLPATKPSQGWEVRAALLGSRIDAAAHSERVREIRKRLLKDGGVLVGQIAKVSKPGGRPKLVYVEKGNGTPYLSGRQILQTTPIGLKYLSAVSIAANSKYTLGEGDVIFQADGRAEESMGYPSMALGERVGWLASGHVGRFTPRNIKDAGWLWAATACDVVQEQIASSACGSVVDSVYPETLETMVLPKMSDDESSKVLAAWRTMAEAEKLENRSIDLIDAEMARLGIYGHSS